MKVLQQVRKKLRQSQRFAWPRTCLIAGDMPRLLVIDDDESVRKVLRFRLCDAYEIYDSSSAEEALGLVLLHKPDAILLDLMMPMYSGFEVCQTLSSLSFTQQIPIVIVSGQSGEKYREFCENIGAKGYFEKPVDFDALEKKLVDLIGLSHLGPRSEPRVRLRVMLELKGIDSKQGEFDLTTATDTVGPTAFLCALTAPLDVDAEVQVYLAEGGKSFAGKARVTRVDRPDTIQQRYDFQFTEKPSNWVLE
jgi:CheY-like chemotaxis protein